MRLLIYARDYPRASVIAVAVFPGLTSINTRVLFFCLICETTGAFMSDARIVLGFAYLIDIFNCAGQCRLDTMNPSPNNSHGG